MMPSEWGHDAPAEPVTLGPMTRVLYDQAVSVGTTQVVQLLPMHGQRWVVLRADPNNTGTVYVGTNQQVAAGSDWPLAKGDATPVLWTDQALYLIASAAGQLVYAIQGGAAG